MSKVAMNKLAAGVALASIFAVSSAQGSIIYSVSGPGISEAEAAEQDFLGSLHPGTGVTEGFEDEENFTSGMQASTFSTKVGSFTGSGGATGDSCNVPGTFVCGEGMGIVGMDDTDLVESDGRGGDSYWGRFPIPQGEDNNNYLDSLDHKEISIDVMDGKNAVGFFLTDPNDAGGNLSIGVTGYEDAFSENIADIVGDQGGNKTGFYLSFYSFESDISSLTLNMNDPSDGIGFDNVSVGRVPEPGTLALMGLGLVGLAFARRRSGNQEQAAA